MTKYLDNEGLTHFTGKMKGYADGKAGEVDGKVTSHVDNKKNPHGVTKAQIGLSKVIDETQLPANQKGKPNGVATLDAEGKVPVVQMPTTKRINGESIFGSGNLQLSASLYKIVDELPTKNIDTSKIYLVPASATTAKNNKTEYIYLGDPNKAYDESKWEKLGDEQKSTTITTPGGSIKVDTAFDTTSSNPIANKTVTDKFAIVDGALGAKVAQDTYDTKMTAIDSKLKTLENKTIDVDAELGDTSNPVQNRAVNAAVLNLNTEIGKKANSSDLSGATTRITTLENNIIESITPLGDADGNGVASIEKDGKTLKVTKGTFVTSTAGLVTKSDLNTKLNDYVTDTALGQKGFLTDIVDHEHVNDLKVTEVQSGIGNGIASISKNGKTLNVTKGKFLTAHQSLADYATKTWVGDQGFAKGTIPTKVGELQNDSGFLTETALAPYVNNVDKATSDLPNYSGFAVSYMQKKGNKLEFELKPFLNTLQVEDTVKKDGNGIAEISIDTTRKYKLLAKKGKFITEATLGTSINDYASKQGYLTENNLNEKLKETITIKLVSDKSASDTNLNGATVTVKSGDTTVSTQTWQGTPIKVEVPCDKDVTIEAATVKMYIKPKALKYIPSPLYNREVVFTYKAQETGVFIIDKNDKLYKTTGEFTQSGLPKTDIVGALLVTDKVAIVISAQLFNEAKWSNKNGLIDGCTAKSDATTAAQDFAGAANTAAIIKANAGLDTAASKCNNYVFKNGKKGHLMSGGEAIEIQRNLDRINSVLQYINSSNTLDENRSYWTSTQKDSGTAWGIRMGDSTLYESFITIPGTSVMGTNTVFPIYSLYD